MSVALKDITKLRELTGAGMMDCKKALSEAGGNIDEAVDFLRKKGLSVAAKKSSRVASEGLVAFFIDGNQGVALEVNSETDFVARNEEFRQFVDKLVKIALKAQNVDELKTLEYESGKTVEEKLIELIAKIGENISIRRLKHISVGEEGYTIEGYVHNSLGGNMGQIVSMVAIKSPDNKDIGSSIAMHIAATAPKSLSSKDLDEKIVEHEKNIQREIALQSGKPADIVEKMLEGRIKKFYEEVCLLEQSFVMDPDKTIEKFLKEKEAFITDFSFMKLGDGIEKEETNFAEEVASIAKGG